MSTGTIHPVDQNLFLVEGEGSSWLPGAAVLRSGDRLYLLDTGAGPHQRSAIQAVAASFGPAGELILVNSGAHPGLVGNNDLLDTCAARARTHLRRRVLSAFDAASDPSEVARIPATYPSPRSTLVPAEPLEAVAEATCLVAGGITWAGWRLAEELLIVQVTARTGRLAFLLPDQRALLLPEELLLTPRWPGSDLADVAQVSALVSALHGEDFVDVVSMGFGVPLDVAAARSALDTVNGPLRAIEPSVAQTRASAHLMSGGERRCDDDPGLIVDADGSSIDVRAEPGLDGTVRKCPLWLGSPRGEAAADEDER